MILTALLLAAACPAQQAAVLPFPLQEKNGHLVADLPAMAELALHDQVVLTGCNLPGDPGTELLLRRVLLASSEGPILHVNGQPSSQRVDEDLTMWTGTLGGDQSTSVYLAISPWGSRGWVRRPSGLVHLLAGPHPVLGWRAPVGEWMTEDAILAAGGDPRWACGDLPMPPGPAPSLPRIPTPRSPIFGAHVDPMLECRVAVETDDQLFNLFGSLDATRTYTVSLFGAVSNRYREQIRTILTMPYLGLYTGSGDPWSSQESGAGAGGLLTEFVSAWGGAIPGNAHLAAFISGANLGGGVAYLNVLCNTDFGFSVSGNIDGSVPFPVSQGPLNWDFMVTAHELGHNFGTPHTHDYCPPLDECAPSGYFGGCQGSQVCTSQGTIMSYCHLCGGGLNNITTYFHDVVVDAMRSDAEASCLPMFDGILVADLGQGLAGSGGTPVLQAGFNGTNNELVFQIDQAPFPEVGLLVGGAWDINMPLFGGLLIPAMHVKVAFSSASPTYALPPIDLSGFSFPDGTTTWWQAWFTDFQGGGGFASTNGLEIELITPELPSVTWIQHPVNGLEYGILDTFLTWPEAKTLAADIGADLATITDANLEGWIKSTFVQSGLVSAPFWMGLNDIASEGTFVWSSGTPVSFTHWMSGQPNDYSGQDWGEVYNSEMEWNDTDSKTNPGLLERPHP